MNELLPELLLRYGPGELRVWHWLAMPVLGVLAWAPAKLASRTSRRLVATLVRRTTTRWDDALIGRLGGPLTLAWFLLIAWLLVQPLGWPRAPLELPERATRSGMLIALFWGLVRGVDVAAQAVAQSGWAGSRAGLRGLIPLGGRLAKIAVVAFSGVTLLSEAGYPVASLLAGLGIGGIAVALAAQKTVENLFGAFSLGADQPFREGDFVRIEEMVGTVEQIGLRSTRIRTLDRTLVSIPNGRLADMRLESFSARDRMRLACDLGVVYGTTVEQMRQVLRGLERVLRSHPKIWPDAVVVRFKELAESSLNIEVMAWFQTPDWSEFQLIRQEVLLGFMAVVEDAGTSFAFPTRTIHIAETTTRAERKGMSAVGRTVLSPPSETVGGCTGAFAEVAERQVRPDAFMPVDEQELGHAQAQTAGLLAHQLLPGRHDRRAQACLEPWRFAFSDKTRDAP